MPQDHYFYRVNGLLKKIHLEKIIYIEASDNYTKFYLNKEASHVVRITFDAALSMLPEKSFLRVSRSFAVNMDYLEEIDREWAYIRTEPVTQIPVSKQYYALIPQHIKILENKQDRP